MRSFALNTAINVVQPLATLLATPARAASNIIDRQGFDSVGFHMFVGIGGITFTTANYLGLLCEESDDNVTWSLITDRKRIVAGIQADGVPNTLGIVGEITVAKPAADTFPLIRKWDYVGDKRYVSFRPGFVGTHATGTPVSVTCVLGTASYSPV